MDRTTVKMVREPSQLSTAVFKRILVAVDGSESSSRAAKVALDLADKLKAELTVLHAIIPITAYYRSSLASGAGAIAPPPLAQKEIDAYYAYARRVANGIAGETVTEAEKRNVKIKTDFPEAVSSVVETIIGHAEKEHADLIVVGTRGLGGFKKMIIGSVSSGIISHAACPVLVVR
jgi:nucleotide-binding universal stress UspA family protein